MSDETKDILKEEFSSPISALGVDQSLKRIVVIENGTKQTKVTKILDSHNRSSDYVPLIPGVTKALPSHSNDGLLIANISHVVSMDSSKTFYQGQRIDDIAIDYCKNFLYVIEDGSLYFVSLNGSDIIKQPTDAPVQLVTSHVIVTKNNDISHSDGFAIASVQTGKKICSSVASKSYNIRAVAQFKNQLFLLDAQNLVVWNLNLDETSSICDLKPWSHLTSQGQLMDLVILNNSIVCMDNESPNDQYLTTPSLPGTTHSLLDSCHNYCINGGSCAKTTLGVPVCHCQPNFTGNRCEIETCHNFCLNNGVCNISHLGAPECNCTAGFEGTRCQMAALVAAAPPILDYHEAFIITSSLCFVFLAISVILAIFMLRSKLNKSSSPVVVKKTPRTRVFSTSSNGRSRSRSASKKSRNVESCGAVNEAFKDSKTDNTSGHMCQALISDDGVVLDLEDCCNMTVCEKPCVEASFRKPNYRKKNQQKLLLDQDDLF